MRRRPYRILLPLANPRSARDLLMLGAGMGAGRTVEMTALGVVVVPEGASLSEGAPQARTARRRLQRVVDLGLAEGVTARTSVRISHSAADGVIDAADELESDLIVFDWRGPLARAQTKPVETDDAAAERVVFSPTIDAVVRASPADIAVVRRRRLERIRSILVPVRGGPHAELAMRMARDLAKRFSASIVVLHVAPEGISARAMQRQRDALDRFVAEHVSGRRVRGLLVTAKSVRRAIVRESSAHDLVLMGASAQPSNATADGRFLFGMMADGVAARAPRTVIVVKTGQRFDLATFDELARADGTFAEADAYADPQRTLATRVDRWFAENSFHAREFSDLRRLVDLKHRQGLTISLGLPTLNEAKTIGLVISRIRRALVDRVPLIDQLVVIDSESTDRTVAIATELGVPVIQHRDILPEMGSHSGKGEALWKSLHVLDGDIVAWVDTDIVNIQPRFVYGLLGPLLRQPRIGYVKGFYRRPIREGSTLVPDGGGRVTELMARPLINLFFPELSGLVQPLAGEYAGRRALLESVPFFTGYGVEIGLLIDILEAAGLSAIGQVDLEQRIHRNQPLADLSRMSFTILQAAIRKLEERHRLELLTEMGRAMKVLNLGPGGFKLEVRELGDEIRPPMNSVPAYRERRRGLGPKRSG